MTFASYMMIAVIILAISLIAIVLIQGQRDYDYQQGGGGYGLNAGALKAGSSEQVLNADQLFSKR